MFNKMHMPMSYWVGYNVNRRSTSGFVFLIGSRAISWRSKKQPPIALLNREAEYRGTVVVACDTIWLKRIMKDLDISINDPILIYYNKLRSIHLVRACSDKAHRGALPLHSGTCHRGGMSTFNISVPIFKLLTSSPKLWGPTSFGNFRLGWAFRSTTCRA